MKMIEYVVTDSMGLHARPAGQLVKIAGRFQSRSTLIKGEKEVDLRRLLAVMSLGVMQNDLIQIQVEGEDEDAAAAEMKQFLKDNV